MAYTSDYLKVNVYGTVAGGDVWNAGFHIRTSFSAGAWTYDNLVALAEVIHTPVSTWWTAVKPYSDSAIALTGLKLYAYPQAGGNAYLTYDRPESSAVAGSSTSHLPLFVSVCNSMRSLHAGRSGRGRMYVPSNGLSLASGQFAQAIATAQANATAAMFSTINAQDWSSYNVTSHQVCVVSRVTSAFYDVTSVVVDSKPDTQHRRDNKIPPTYTQSAGVT